MLCKEEQVMCSAIPIGFRLEEHRFVFLETKIQKTRLDKENLAWYQVEHEWWWGEKVQQEMETSSESQQSILPAAI